MDVVLVDDPVAFLDQAAPFLLEDEARHNLILGLASTIRDDPGLYPERRFWLVKMGKDIVAAALQTPPYNLVLARPRDDAALDALVAGIEEEIAGVVGALPEVLAFAERWGRRHTVATRTVFAQGVYALERVQPVPQPSGRLREASRADEELLLDWLDAFAMEALHEGEPGRDHHQRVVDYRLGSADAGFVLWEDGGEPVSLVGYGGPTPNGIRIGPVYTPPEHRRRGYASALVADVSSELLAAGRRFCFLFTDLGNPTSNAIYERIGYGRVCEAAQLAFDPV